jgi:hypothetical protein
VSKRKARDGEPAAKPRGLSEPYERITDVEGVSTTVFRAEDGRMPGFHGSPLELTVIRGRGVTHTDAVEPWVALEIWTLHRIYLVGGQMRCIGVHDRTANRSEPTHPLIGAMLSGGRGQVGDDVHLTQPFPLPGTKAVFRYEVGERSATRFATTSVVERVVLRLAVTVLEGSGPADAAHDLTARFFMRTS